MVERYFSQQTYHAEHTDRIAGLVIKGEMDAVKPNEVIIRTMREAIQLGNPFIREGDPFVVMGNDGFGGSWFPTGSFQTVEEALEHAGRKKGEEYLYSDGDEISTTFHIFTGDGIQVKHVSEMELPTTE